MHDITIEDDRTTPADFALPFLVLMTDRCLSGWGSARGRPSFAAWACSLAELDNCEAWVRSRSDALRVRIVGRNYRPSRSCHLHIYLWKENRA